MNSDNEYDTLSLFHPIIPELHNKRNVNNNDNNNNDDDKNNTNTKYYWILGVSLSKENLLKKGRENLELANQLQDVKYISFLNQYLNREGYEVDLNKYRLDNSINIPEFENAINNKAKVKITIFTNNSNKNNINTIVDSNLNTHSKLKAKQHEKAMAIQKIQESLQEKKIITNPHFIKAISMIGYKVANNSNNEIIVSGLRKAITIYVQKNDLQNKTMIKLDSKLKDVLFPSDDSHRLNEISYFDLKEILGRKLLNVNEESFNSTNKLIGIYNYDKDNISEEKEKKRIPIKMPRIIKD